MLKPFLPRLHSALQELWRSAGFDEIETRVISVPVTFSNFEEFWGSMSLPVGTAGQAIAQMNSDQLERLRALRGADAR
jgi:hypothetical protein